MVFPKASSGETNPQSSAPAHCVPFGNAGSAVGSVDGGDTGAATRNRGLATGAMGADRIVIETQGVPSGPISTGNRTVTRSPGASDPMPDWRARLM